VSSGIADEALSPGPDGREIGIPPEPDTPEPAEIERTLETVRRTVAEVLAATPRPPRTLRIRAGDVCVELEWPDGSPAPLALVQQAIVGHPQPPPHPAPSAAKEMSADSQEALVAPMVGVFYSALEPGDEPFVTEGTIVTPGQQVAIVEAMKLMIPVEADRAGRIVAVLVADGQSVEYGQPLFTLEPDEITGAHAE
jgi:acetyl-CoA carboxylase biotin carboxyl carrier protein